MTLHETLMIWLRYKNFEFSQLGQNYVKLHTLKIKLLKDYPYFYVKSKYFRTRKVLKMCNEVMIISLKKEIQSISQ